MIIDGLKHNNYSKIIFLLVKKLGYRVIISNKEFLKINEEKHGLII